MREVAFTWWAGGKHKATKQQSHLVERAGGRRGSSSLGDQWPRCQTHLLRKQWLPGAAISLQSEGTYWWRCRSTWNATVWSKSETRLLIRNEQPGVSREFELVRHGAQLYGSSPKYLSLSISTLWPPGRPASPATVTPRQTGKQRVLFELALLPSVWLQDHVFWRWMVSQKHHYQQGPEGWDSIA